MKQRIATDQAPLAIGPYSQAIRHNDLVFVSGQVALNPQTKQIEGNVQQQTRTLLTNLGRILEAAGTGLDRVLKTTVFLSSMDDFAAMNEIYGTFFQEDPPARSTVEVARLPLGALVEIEAVAFIA